MVLAALALAGTTAGPAALAQDDEDLPDDEPAIEVPDDAADAPADDDGAIEEVEPGDDADADDDVIEDDEGEDADAFDISPPNAILSAPARTRVRTLLRQGLTGRISCAEPCSVLLELHRGSEKGPVVGHRTVRVPAAGQRKAFHLRVDAKARRQVRTTTATQLQLTAAAGDAAGNHRIVARRVVLQRRG